MLEARILKRRHLIYYLEVHDQENGELIGHVVDITTLGMKLVSRQALPVGRVYHLRMSLPGEHFREKDIRFTAQALWSSNDVNPDFYDTGFEVSLMDERAKDIIVQLINRLGFND
ncbi:MAG: PilZ domain-containing protein [Desulfobacteraceae bacterium]|nr:PilZ domain-containing protein [Desulfobacteraceae bacterium]